MSELIKLPTEAIEDGSLVNKLKTDIPRLWTGMENVQKATMAIQSISTKEEKDAAMEILVRVRNTYQKMEALRKESSVMLDNLKTYMMTPEKNVNAELDRIKLLVQKFDQEAIKKQKEEEEKARKQKLKEQAIVDLKAKIKLRINENIIVLCQKIENGSKDFFTNVPTLEEFDKKATTYQNTKWKIRQDDYEACFKVSSDILLTEEEVITATEEVKKEMTYEVVNKMYMEKADPLIAIWKSKIPQLRDTLIQMLKAGEEEKERIKKEQEVKIAQESARAADYLNNAKQDMQRSVESEVAVNKIESEFKEQAIVQSLEPTGPKKKVLRFVDDKPVQPLCEIIYHCFMNPKFKGIYKDKVDAQGRKEYIDAIDFWTKQFISLKIDASIKGTVVEEDAKVIVRA